MKDFDAIKDMWQQMPVVETVNTTGFRISNASHNARNKLAHSQRIGAITLVVTAVLILAVGAFANLNFQHWYSYGALVLVALICFAQGAILYFTYLKIKRIDDSAVPGEHLRQWENYYAFRKKLIRINMPVYFISLNAAMGLYLYEVLLGRPMLNVIIFLLLYAGWMLFAIFYLGRKTQRKEELRLQGILDDLRSIENSLQS
jgi:hypothetical protein